jgi:hypothetical protein
MATFTSYNEPPVVPAEQPLDLSAIQAKIEEAFKAGNFRELARLNALVREIANRLTTETRSNERFRRIQVNPEAASEEDRTYAGNLIKNLGAARQMVELTQRAADVPETEAPGPSVGEEVAGVGAALAAGEVGSRALTKQTAKPLQAATTSAKRSLSGQAGAAVRGAKKAKGAASAAGGAVGRASQAVARAASDPIINPTPGTPGTPGTKGAAQKALRTATAEKAAATGAAGAATRTATRSAAEAAAKKGLAKGFASAAARVAPRILGGMPLAMAEVAISPIIASYKSIEQATSFLGQLEILSNLKGGPLGVDDLETSTLDTLSRAPDLLNAMLKSGVIDETAYAFANPEAAAEMGLQIGGGGIQRGGDVFVAKGTGEAGEEFGPDPREGEWRQTQEEMAGKTTDIPRIGADDPTPVARKKAAGRAWSKSREKSPTPKRAAAPTPAPAPPPTGPGEPTPTPHPATYAPLVPFGHVDPTYGMTGAEGLYPEPGQRDPGFATPDLGPPKERKLGQGLKKLLETFANMDVRVDTDVI